MSFNIEHLKQRPHLVILGAGATIATIPAGDKYGRKSSVMDNFISELQLNDLFKNIQLKTNSKNLENIYSELYERNDCQNIRLALEERIFNHFDLLVYRISLPYMTSSLSLCVKKTLLQLLIGIPFYYRPITG